MGSGKDKLGVGRSYDPGSITRGTACLTWVYISRLGGRSMGLGPSGSSRTHAAASTALEAALEGHGRSQRIGRWPGGRSSVATSGKIPPASTAAPVMYRFAGLS